MEKKKKEISAQASSLTILSLFKMIRSSISTGCHISQIQQWACSLRNFMETNGYCIPQEIRDLPYLYSSR